MTKAGYPNAMEYTPRQMYFLMVEETKLQARKAHHELATMALAAQGSSRAIKAQLKALKKAAK